MDLRAERATEAPPAAHPWPAPRPGEPPRHHAGALQGATVTGEAGRPHLTVRIGLWLDGAGNVRQARWRASEDPGLRAAAETACAMLEAAGGARPPAPAALREAGAAAEGAEMVAAAAEAALALAGR